MLVIVLRQDQKGYESLIRNCDNNNNNIIVLKKDVNRQIKV